MDGHARKDAARFATTEHFRSSGNERNADLQCTSWFLMMSLSKQQSRSLLVTIHEIILLARTTAYQVGHPDARRAADLLDDADHLLNILEGQSEVADIHEVVRMICNHRRLDGVRERFENRLGDENP